MKFLIIPIILVNIALVAFLVSYIAKMLYAERPGMGWILLSMITGGIAGIITSILVRVSVTDIDPFISLVATLVVSFVVASAAFKLINKMQWGAAMTTNLASMVLSVIVSIASVFAATFVIDGFTVGEVVQKAVLHGKYSSRVAMTMAEDIKQGQPVNTVLDSNQLSELQARQMSSDLAASLGGDVEMAEDEVPQQLTENQLLKPEVVAAIAKQKAQRYKAPRYHALSLARAASVIGARIRIHKQSGKVIIGSLINTDNGELTVKQHIGKGYATTPVANADIHKLEVYR